MKQNLLNLFQHPKRAPDGESPKAPRTPAEARLGKHIAPPTALKATRVALGEMSLNTLDVPEAPVPSRLKRSPSGQLGTLHKTKSATTLKEQYATAVAEPMPPLPDQYQQREARHKMRIMLGGRLAGPPAQAVAGSLMQLQQSAMAKRDRAILQRIGHHKPGAMPLHCKEEVQSIADYGLTQKIRQEAIELLQKHDPFEMIFDRRVPRAGQAASFAVADSTQQAEDLNNATFSLLRLPPSLAATHDRKHAVAHLQAFSGSNYLVGFPLNAGSFKQFSPCINDKGWARAALMMREHEGRDVFRQRGVAVCDREIIKEEITNISAHSDHFPVDDILVMNKTWIVVTQLFDAGDLMAAFGRLQPAVRPKAALQLLPDILAQILDLNHKRKVVHGDIKMENIFLTSAGKVAIADFGLARKLNATGAVRNGIWGTYFAPEQISLMRADASLDLWALGATLGDLVVPQGDEDPINPHAIGFDVGQPKGLFEKTIFLAKFSEFRNSLFDNSQDGLFDLCRLSSLQVTRQDQDYDDFVLYYQYFAREAPLLAHFCLEYLLEPNTGLRGKETPATLIGIAELMRNVTGGPVTFTADPAITASLTHLRAAQRELHRRGQLAA